MKRRRYRCVCGTTYYGLKRLGECLATHMDRVYAVRDFYFVRCWCGQSRYYCVPQDRGQFGPCDLAKHVLEHGIAAHYLTYHLGIGDHGSDSSR